MTKYVAATLSNKTSQEIRNTVQQFVDRMDSYIDSFEKDFDGDIDLLDMSAYHLTLIDSEDEFECNVQSLEHRNIEAKSVEFVIHEDYLVLEVFSDDAEDINEYLQNIGGYQEDYFPYIAVARISGLFPTEDLQDMVDYANDELIFDIDIETENVYALENTEDDWEKDPDNYQH